MSEGTGDASYQSLNNRDVGYASLVSNVVGIAIGLGLALAVAGIHTGTGYWVALGMWAIGMGVFHQGEFTVVALARPKDMAVKSFLLPGLGASREYNIAMACGLAEFSSECFFFPSMKAYPSLALACGAAMTAFAVIRIVAMLQCGNNFSHLIETDHRPDHQLVTTGLYAYLRHPAYFGWFWWSIFSQLTLLNPISALLYAYVAHSFFSSRIPFEEDQLASDEFFGHQYSKYKKSVPTGIPLIP
ncbi:Protein-S-isoprenylcysteine O-methyltransferase [Diplonema papillatum]|nr:Protein-S-isoprenylcysteine O-methyltransferase [Diplonema papillatum]|eukprot:gene13635-20981_t